MTYRHLTLSSLNIAALTIALTLGLAACGHDAPPTVALPPLGALETFTVTADGNPTGMTWDGVVEAVQQATLTAQTSGQIETMQVDVNDVVTRGQTLATLAGVEQRAGTHAARAQLRAAEAAVAEATQTHKRYQELVKKGYVSKIQMDQVTTARNAAIAHRDAARAQLSQASRQNDYTRIQTPFDGIISQRLAEPGESVAPGRPLLVLYAPDAMRIEVDVPQSVADMLRAQSPLQATITTDDGRSLPLRDITIYPAADPISHSVTVRLNLATSATLPPPGTTAKVRFALDTVALEPNATSIMIPTRALQHRGEVTGVYVLSADGKHISLRQLRLGATHGQQVEVLSGLQPGETVAADPLKALAARVAQRQAASPEAH